MSLKDYQYRIEGDCLMGPDGLPVAYHRAADVLIAEGRRLTELRLKLQGMERWYPIGYTAHYIAHYGLDTDPVLAAAKLLVQFGHKGAELHSVGDFYGPDECYTYWTLNGATITVDPHATSVTIEVE